MQLLGQGGRRAPIDPRPALCHACGAREAKVTHHTGNVVLAGAPRGVIASGFRFLVDCICGGGSIGRQTIGRYRRVITGLGEGRVGAEPSRDKRQGHAQNENRDTRQHGDVISMLAMAGF